MSKGIVFVHETSGLRKQNSQTLFLLDLLHIKLLTKIELATNVCSIIQCKLPLLFYFRVIKAD